MYDVGQGKPDRPESANRPDRGQTGGSLLPVLTVLGVTVGAVLVLVAFTGVAGLFVVLAIGGLLGFIALHYMVWGWWLGKAMRAESRREEDQSDAEA